jgi:hypothetical protein
MATRTFWKSSMAARASMSEMHHYFIVLRNDDELGLAIEVLMYIYLESHGVGVTVEGRIDIIGIPFSSNHFSSARF